MLDISLVPFIQKNKQKYTLMWIFCNVLFSLHSLPSLVSEQENQLCSKLLSTTVHHIGPIPKITQYLYRSVALVKAVLKNTKLSKLVTWN